MFNAEIRRMLVQVITSWQVLTVTAVLIIYFALVNYVARVYHKRRRRTLMPKIKFKKGEKGTPEEAPEAAAGSGESVVEETE